MNKTIQEWQTKLGISQWDITTEKIDPKQVIYEGEKYFIGISIDWENSSGVIYHDIDLTEESIIHELLHIRYPKKNEEWINETTTQYLHSKYQY